jgi:hypothetical protein
MDQYHFIENKQSLYFVIYESLSFVKELLACVRCVVMLSGVKAFTEQVDFGTFQLFMTVSFKTIVPTTKATTKPIDQ